ncbi:MAG: aldo/keto reductase [Desulfuromonadales bacterium]|nr:aldo/keto reductase [Desulfuromonadales bacterium]
MRTRTLGQTRLQVSEISFGAWQLGNSQAWGKMDDRRAHRLVAEAIDNGVNLFDTAPNYASGRSEELLGRALPGKRDQVVLVSKFGHQPNGEQNFSASTLCDSLDRSLRRLRTDYLDVLLVHNPPNDIYQKDETLWHALDQARQQGKIKHYGASLDFADEAEACLNNTNSEVLEVFFNILHQDIRRAFPLVREKGAGIIVKVPLDSGWLTGRFTARSRFTGVRSRWSREQIQRRAELVDGLGWLTEDGSTLAGKALAFLLSYEEVSCVIPGVRNRSQLHSNLDAAQCSVSDEAKKMLEEYWDTFTSKGSVLLPW